MSQRTTRTRSPRAEEWNPTPRQIRQLCQEIQTRWSPAERKRRRVFKPAPTWQPPTVQTTELWDIDESAA